MQHQGVLKEPSCTVSIGGELRGVGGSVRREVFGDIMGEIWRVYCLGGFFCFFVFFVFSDLFLLSLSIAHKTV